MTKTEEQFAVAMNQAEVDNKTIGKVLQYLKEIKEEEKAAKDAEPSTKKEYKLVGLIPTEDGDEDIPLEDRAILVTKMELEDDHNVLPPQLRQVALTHNDSRSAKKQGKIYTVNDLVVKASKGLLKKHGLDFQHGGALYLVECDRQLVPEDD
jgi:hypothetical protein